MSCFCIWLMGFVLGMGAACFLYAWLDEREDAYAGLVIPETGYTAIEWSLRKYSIPDQYAVQPKKRAGGHLGHLDHKARQRLTEWIAQVPSPLGA